MRKYFIRTSKKRGKATLYFQLKSDKHSFKMSTVNSRISVDIAAWGKAPETVKEWQKFAATDEGKNVVEQINKLEDAINLLLEGDDVTPDDVIRLIKDIDNYDAKVAEKERQEFEQAEEEAAKTEILNYFHYFLDGMKIGAIKYGKRTKKRYGDSTIAIYETFGRFLMEWLKDTPHLMFDELTKQKAAQFFALMERKKLMANTRNKMTNCMRHLVNSAKDDGLVTKLAPVDLWGSEDVGTKQETTKVYVTNAELDALYLSNVDSEEEQTAKDVFLFGAIIGQRFSDVINLERSNFEFDNGDTYLFITQQKTGTEVALILNDERALEIAKKYNYELPTIGHQRMNVLIKKLFQRISVAVPSLSENVVTILSGREAEAEAHYQELCNRKRDGETLSENDRKTLSKLSMAARQFGGKYGQIYSRDKKNRVIKPKWALISTHTARRSFVTNALEDGTYNHREIMDMTGHKNERVFDKYNRAELIAKARQRAAKKEAAKNKQQAKTVRMKRAN